MLSRRGDGARALHEGGLVMPDNFISLKNNITHEPACLIFSTSSLLVYRPAFAR